MGLRGLAVFVTATSDKDDEGRVIMPPVSAASLSDSMAGIRDHGFASLTLAADEKHSNWEAGR